MRKKKQEIAEQKTPTQKALKKHLCLDVRFIRASGIGTFLQNVLLEISKNRPFVLTLLHYEKDRDFLLRFKPDALISVKSAHYTLKEQWELPLKIPSCDFFWSPHYAVPVLPIRARKRLTTIHDVNHLVHFSTLRLLQKLYAKTMFFISCRHSDHITTVSRFSKKEILKYCRVDEKKLTAIPFGVSADFFPRKENEALRKKLSLPKRYLVTVTNFKPHKNFERIIQASSSLLPLVVVGEKRNSKDFFSTGFLEIEELAFVYSHAEALIFPSLYEGFGSPPLESAACGSPVVVSNQDPFKEILEEAAEYVDPYDVISIRKGILNILENPKRREDLVKKGLALCGRKKAELSIKQHIDLIESLV